MAPPMDLHTEQTEPDEPVDWTQPIDVDDASDTRTQPWRKYTADAEPSGEASQDLVKSTDIHVAG